MDTWRHGNKELETRKHGDIDMRYVCTQTGKWRHGDIGNRDMEIETWTWRHGDTKTLRHKDMETLRHRDMDMEACN
jgi:hypothetical protein